MLTNFWELTGDELLNYGRKPNECPNCGGFGDIPEAGMFSKTYKCEICKGTGIIKIKQKINSHANRPSISSLDSRKTN